MNLKKLQSLETKIARAEEALAAIKALAELERSEILAERGPKKVDAKETEEDRRGYAGRNGRMDIIREVVQKMGTTAKTADVLDKVNAVSVERGLKPIKKAAFYTLISEVRRERTTVDFRPGVRDKEVVVDTTPDAVKVSAKKSTKQTATHH